MKLFLSLLFLSTSLVFCAAVEQKSMDYFQKIALGAEFGRSTSKVVKWVKPIKIYVSGKAPKQLDEELSKIILELNTLTKPLNLSRVEKEKDANFIVCFGSDQDYLKIQPASKKYLSNNWGLFFIYWNHRKEIYKGSMYVDIIRCKDKQAQKHLLREELTQALGLMKDSNMYQDSIFYDRWKPHTIEYSKLDKSIIRLLYNEKVKPGMSLKEVKELSQ